MSSIPYLYVPFSSASPETLELPDDTAQHVGTVLRLRDGETVRIFNGEGLVGEGRVERSGKRSIRFHWERKLDWDNELPLRIRIVQSLPKQSERLEDVLQHGTEMGVSEFAVFQSRRSVARWEASKSEQRLERWRRIVQGAAEQSKRTRMPSVEWLERANPTVAGMTIVLHESGASPLANVLPVEVPDRFTLLVGPEGGFDDGEVEEWAESGARIAHLGPRILRTETAALAAVSRILGHYRL